MAEDVRLRFIVIPAEAGKCLVIFCSIGFPTALRRRIITGHRIPCKI